MFSFKNQIKDKMLSKDGLYEMAKIFYNGDESKVKSCMNIYDQCHGETADDECEAASKISWCLKMHGEKNGIVFAF